MSRPSLQGLLPLTEKLVTLIDRRNARDRAGLVIKNLVGNVRRNAETCHPGNTGAAQVVQPPVSYPTELIQCSFRPAKCCKRSGSELREHQRPLGQPVSILLPTDPRDEPHELCRSWFVIGGGSRSAPLSLFPPRRCPPLLRGADPSATRVQQCRHRGPHLPSRNDDLRKLRIIQHAISGNSLRGQWHPIRRGLIKNGSSNTPAQKSLE